MKIKLTVIFILLIATFITVDRYTSVEIPQEAQSMLVSATILSQGRILSRPKFNIIPGKQGILSQSSEEDSLTFKVLAHSVRGNEVLLDVDYCQGKEINDFEAPEDGGWCEFFSEQKLMVKLGELTEVKIDDTHNIQIRIDQANEYNVGVRKSWQRILKDLKIISAKS